MRKNMKNVIGIMKGFVFIAIAFIGSLITLESLNGSGISFINKQLELIKVSSSADFIIGLVGFLFILFPLFFLWGWYWQRKYDIKYTIVEKPDRIRISYRAISQFVNNEALKFFEVLSVSSEIDRNSSGLIILVKVDLKQGTKVVDFLFDFQKTIDDNVRKMLGISIISEVKVDVNIIAYDKILGV